MNEIELKFTIDEPTARQFWKRGQISKLMSGHPRSSVLKSTYLDTPDHALWEAGIPKGGLIFSKLSKGARGYMLAREGRIDVAIAPRSAHTVALHPKQTAEQAARDILRECIDQIAANIGVIEKLDDPEGPHQLRVGLRRLRSAFAVFTPVVGGAEMARLNAEARWLGREVGRLRDLDAITNDVVLKQAEAHPDESGLPLLAEALRSEVAGVREQLRAILIDGRTQAMLIDLVRFVETRAWIDTSDVGQAARLQAPVRKLARAALARRWVKVGKRARHLANLTAAQRHELRKELKKLRYAVEFFAKLFPAKRAERFLGRLKALQVVFGDLNDVVVMKALFASSHPRFANDPRLQRPIGWVIGASRTRADMQWNRTTALWRKFKKSRVFWN